MVTFRRLELPDIGIPAEVPEIPAQVYRRRFERLEAAVAAAGYDALALYADREHRANLAWLTGYDPRFEEALWLYLPGRTPTLLVGNENLDYAPGQLKIDTDTVLYQTFSLPGQDRSRDRELRSLLAEAGWGHGLRVGLIGWKALPQPDLPYWLVAAIQDLTGEEADNATELLIDPDSGLRVVLEPEMIRLCEHAAALTSEGVKRLIFGLREGMREHEAAAALDAHGLELSCHPMVNIGRPIASGLGSAGNTKVTRGAYLQTAFGIRGGLTCRAGRLVSAGDPKLHDDDNYLELVSNYLEVVHAWYGASRVGTTAGEVVAAAAAAKDDSWDFALNPGHLTHLDEWLHSPYRADSTTPLQSGYAVQQDIIPVPRRGAASLNMEDGLVLADEDLRAELERLDPALMKRCQARRELMARLGYQLHPDVLPLSNLAGTFFPFLLDPTTVAHFT